MLELPNHPVTGLTAVGVLPSGRIVWPVMGGDRTNDAGGGNGGGDGGGQGSGQGSGQGQGGGEGSGNGGEGGEGGGDQTFTQADVDRIVSQRLRRARQEVADYDDLKVKAAKYDDLEAANKSEQDKLTERATTAEKRAEDAERRADQTLVRSEIAVHAAAAGAVDIADVVALLTGSDDVTVGKDGRVEGAKEAVASMKKDKPHLFGGGASGGGFQQGARRGEGDGGPSVTRGRDLYESRKKR